MRQGEAPRLLGAPRPLRAALCAGAAQARPGPRRRGGAAPPPPFPPPGWPHHLERGGATPHHFWGQLPAQPGAAPGAALGAAPRWAGPGRARPGLLRPAQAYHRPAGAPIEGPLSLALRRRIEIAASRRLDPAIARAAIAPALPGGTSVVEPKVLGTLLAPLHSSAHCSRLKSLRREAMAGMASMAAASRRQACVYLLHAAAVAAPARLLSDCRRALPCALPLPCARPGPDLDLAPGCALTRANLSRGSSAFPGCWEHRLPRSSCRLFGG